MLSWDGILLYQAMDVSAEDDEVLLVCKKKWTICATAGRMNQIMQIKHMDYVCL